MTRDEAIKVLEQMKDGFIAVHNGNPVMYGFSDYGVQAFDMAINALEALDNTQNTLQHVGSVEEGLISRQDVLGYIDRLDTTGLGKGKALEYIRKYVERSQSVDLVRCGECKYQNKSENEREPWNLCDYRPWIYKPISDDYFCGDGERRNDEEL